MKKSTLPHILLSRVMIICYKWFVVVITNNQQLLQMFIVSIKQPMYVFVTHGNHLLRFFIVAISIINVYFDIFIMVINRSLYAFVTALVNICFDLFIVTITHNKHLV